MARPSHPQLLGMGKAMLSSMKGVGSSRCRWVPPVFFICISASGSRSSPSLKSAATQRVSGARLGTIFLGLFDPSWMEMDNVLSSDHLGPIYTWRSLWALLGGLHQQLLQLSLFSFNWNFALHYWNKLFSKVFPILRVLVLAVWSLSGFSPTFLFSTFPTPASSLRVIFVS